jgi:predicted TIM-barrel fold metal-dependent hydrolase
MSVRSNPDVERVRRRLDHPIIDSDGHVIEYLPVVRDHVAQLAGRSVAERFTAQIDRMLLWKKLTPAQRKETGFMRPPFWGLPARNTLDRATAMLPALMYERLDELGIDFAVLYPTYGLMPLNFEDEEVRRAGCRAFNRYAAEQYAQYRDRLAPVAIIPMHTPQEAVEELDYAVRALGLKVATLPSFISRPLPAAGGAARPAQWMDTYGPDSDHDYDPVWARCVELGISPTFHSGGMGWGSRASSHSYVYNHIGNFAAAGEAICRSLFLGGVTHRFPALRCAFLEGGTGWAASLYADLIGHWEKRNASHIQHYNPAHLDRRELEALFAAHAPASIRARLGELDYALQTLSNPDEPLGEIDEFAASGVSEARDVARAFGSCFFFGCEADDPSNALAFDSRRNPFGLRLNAVFSSDIGHWDVPDMREVVVEAYELVERGLISDDDFRDFAFANPARLWRESNPDFFRHTAVEAAVSKLPS